MVTVEGQPAAGAAAGGVPGFPAALTSFVGRTAAVRAVAGLQVGPVAPNSSVRRVGTGPHTQPNGSVRFRTVGAHDRIVAATAIAAGWRVATANVRDFERVPGLDVVDIKLT